MIRLSFPQQTIIAIRVNYRFVRTCSQSSLREFDAKLNDTLRKIIGYCVKDHKFSNSSTFELVIFA